MKGDNRIDVYFDGDTIWISQRTMAELYQVDGRLMSILLIFMLKENRMKLQLSGSSG